MVGQTTGSIRLPDEIVETLAMGLGAGLGIAPLVAILIGFKYGILIGILALPATVIGFTLIGIWFGIAIVIVLKLDWKLRH